MGKHSIFIVLTSGKFTPFEDFLTIYFNFSLYGLSEPKVIMSYYWHTYQSYNTAKDP